MTWAYKNAYGKNFLLSWISSLQNLVSVVLKLLKALNLSDKYRIFLF